MFNLAIACFFSFSKKNDSPIADQLLAEELDNDPNYQKFLKARLDRDLSKEWSAELESLVGIDRSGNLRYAKEYYPIAVRVEDTTWYCTQDGEWIER